VEVKIQQMRGQKEKDIKGDQLKRWPVEGDDGEQQLGSNTLEGAKDCLDWKARPR
jgi:hypothetical protein